jgi:uncharacterized membrane protein
MSVSIGYDGGVGHQVDLSVLYVALEDSAREAVQSALRSIASTGDSRNGEGRLEMLRSAIQLLRDERGHWTHAAARNASPMPQPQAKERFAAAAYAARTRFRHELIRNADGVITETAPPVLDGGGPGAVVVTLVVAARVELADVVDPSSSDQLDEALAALERLDPYQLVALEVIWTPADERERVPASEIEAKWPELRRLA